MHLQNCSANVMPKYSIGIWKTELKSCFCTWYSYLKCDDNDEMKWITNYSINYIRISTKPCTAPTLFDIHSVLLHCNIWFQRYFILEDAGEAYLSLDVSDTSSVIECLSDVSPYLYNSYISHQYTAFTMISKWLNIW